jgi:hypothetical protein
MEDITTARHGTQGIDRIREKPIWLYSAIFSGTWLGGDVQHIAMNGHLTQNGSTTRKCRQKHCGADEKLDSEGLLDGALEGNHRQYLGLESGRKTELYALKFRKFII